MSQQPLFTIQLIDEIESPYTHARDAKVLGIDAARNEYLLKRVQDDELLPLTEWICHHLCRMSGIPTPEFSIVLSVDGKPSFGSLIDNTAVDFNKDALSNPQKINILQSSSASVSSALALDCFLPNPDRHFGNWLYVNRRGKYVALAIDWSQVDAFHNPAFQRWPWNNNCLSTEIIQILHKYNAFDDAVFRNTLGTLKKIADNDLEAIIRSAPEFWREQVSESDIIIWWRDFLHIRIKACEAMITPP